ncbi:uncharacterized protein A4U43_C03F31870 [Asparagus officinalis]|uniref:Uncharacterized protein n=1 Tax=Asparagus officinalis TaxID=4686 RepID=A0A5P1FF79_ASPOF|nr:uncharacterized protein A4U43_C03F31870 [Asparagus officinalis]
MRRGGRRKRAPDVAVRASTGEKEEREAEGGEGLESLWATKPLADAVRRRRGWGARRDWAKDRAWPQVSKKWLRIAVRF